MKYQLTKRAIAWVGEGTINPTRFEVEGTPLGFEVFIDQFGTSDPDDWQFVIGEKGQFGEWTGEFSTADAALDAVQLETNRRLN